MEIKDKLAKANWTPLHTRIISHRIGDGTVNFYGHAVYDNKHVNHFMELANQLSIKLWKPVKGDIYNTKKIVIPKVLFEKFSKIFNVNPDKIIRDPVKLLELISHFPEEHKLQTIFALIVDDGSCSDWRITVFEDQNKYVFDIVKNLWDFLFPNTSSTYVYITKKGTKVYHLFAKRNGIISLQQKIQESVKRYGPLANLWWKQKDLDKRYSKAISKRAKLLNDTKEFGDKNKEKILDYLSKNKHITIRRAMSLLNLSLDRTRLVLNKLINEEKIFEINAGNKSRYSIENEDIRIGYRKEIIIQYLRNQKIIYNRDVRKLLNLGRASSYNILKLLSNRKILKQIKKDGKTYYTLPILLL